MDQARHILLGNLALHAEPARRRMAISMEAVSHLVDLPLDKLVAVERGNEVDLTLDELTRLSLFLGLNLRGELRSKTPGSN